MYRQSLEVVIEIIPRAFPVKRFDHGVAVRLNCPAPLGKGVQIREVRAGGRLTPRMEK